MVVLRRVGDIVLNEGDQMVKGLFNLFNVETQELSLWFDSELKDELLNASEGHFLDLADDNFYFAKECGQIN